MKRKPEWEGSARARQGFPTLNRIRRACADAQRAWDMPGVMRVGLGPKVCLEVRDVLDALDRMEAARLAAERERDALLQECRRRCS